MSRESSIQSRNPVFSLGNPELSKGNTIFSYGNPESTLLNSLYQLLE